MKEKENKNFSYLLVSALGDESLKFTAWAPQAPRGTGDCVYAQVGQVNNPQGIQHLPI